MGKCRLEDNICLIGYMGSGKTTVGHELAKRLNMSFADTDELIVCREGRSIPDIFGTEGEEYFRSLETELLKEFAIDKTFTGTVLSTGGGLVVAERNRPLLKAIGRIIYLRASAECLCSRIGDDANRPLLDSPDRLEKIRDMLEYRDPIYTKCADHIIDTDELSLEETIGSIIEIVGKER